MAIKAVLWDMDGVLIDSERHYWDELNAYYDGLGVKMTDEQKRSFIGCSPMKNASKVCEWFPEFGFDEQALCDGHVAALVRGLHLVDGLIDGVEGWVDALHARGVKSTVATSSNAEMLDYAKGAFRLPEVFDMIITSNDVKNPKPAPDIFLEAAKRFGVEPSECLVVEDSQNGVLAAKAAGMRVAVFTGAPGLSGAPIPSGGDVYFSKYDAEAFATLFD